jgi:aspartate kinase
MKTHPGIAAGMFKTLADAGVNIDLISTSPIRISCVISASQVSAAVIALHSAFGLEDGQPIEIVQPVSEGV